jgi:hypothetical protein
MIGVKDNDPAQNQIDWASARRAAKQPGIAAIDGEDMLASAWGICSMERMISSIRHVLFFNGTIFLLSLSCRPLTKAQPLCQSGTIAHRAIQHGNLSSASILHGLSIVAGREIKR